MIGFILTFISLDVFSHDEPVDITVFHLTDPDKKINIYQAIEHPDFSKVDKISALNFGIAMADHWIKIILNNTHADIPYKLSIDAIGADTIEIYQKINEKYQRTLIGEAIFDQERFPTCHFVTTESQTILYLKTTGMGFPISLPLKIEKINITDSQDYTPILMSGVIYGLILLVIILSGVLFVSTKEKVYLYFLFLNIFSGSAIFYFDGFVKFYLFHHSIYWNNQFIAIAFCGSFISANYYIPEFLNIKEFGEGFLKWFSLSNIVFAGILAISFWHPTGFSIYVASNIILTSFVALLFFLCVWHVRKYTKEYFPIQLTSVLLIIFFGTVAQLYFLGILPINIVTRFAVHGMVLPQLLIQSYAMGKRFSILSQERAELLRVSEQHSQSLITTLENERKRLSGEFHDSIGQNLLVIRNRILMMLKSPSPKTHEERLKGLASITSETLEEIRVISQDLRPSTLDSIGLTASLANMIERLKKSTEIKIDFKCEKSIDELVDKDMEINVYRILQELTNNILKHSQASIAKISFQKHPDHLSLEVSDNGVGFNTKMAFVSGGGNGLSGIKERVKLLNGTIHFREIKESGIRITVKIPTQR